MKVQPTPLVQSVKPESLLTPASVQAPKPVTKPTPTPTSIVNVVENNISLTVNFAQSQGRRHFGSGSTYGFGRSWERQERELVRAESIGFLLKGLC